MADRERARQNATLARKSSSFGSFNRNKVASKAARKTFAEPDSNEDSDSTRRTGKHNLGKTLAIASLMPFAVISGRPAFPSMTARVANDSRPRVSFSPDTRMLPNTPRKEVSSRPPAMSSSHHSQRHASFPSKSANQVTPRRDPFADGVRSSVFRPSALPSAPRIPQQQVRIPFHELHFAIDYKHQIDTRRSDFQIPRQRNLFGITLVCDFTF